MENNYCLFFSQHYKIKTNELAYGRLQLCKFNKWSEIWIATSSTSKKQYKESFHKRGALIPPAYRCNFPNWTVKTKPIWMPKIKGVEGNFFKIDPHFVQTDKGGKRGDFGIHYDGNHPGSLGCIVMSKDRFVDFSKKMEKIREEQIKEIPLIIQYS